MGYLKDRDPTVFAKLADLDRQGEMILGTYLYGDGEDHDIYDDPDWTEYMMAHDGLRHQIQNQLILAVRQIALDKKEGRFPIAHTFHAEFPENNGFSGYALLHGSDRTVGDFKILGWADVKRVDTADAFDIELDLRFVFNDIVNPNRKYWMDRVRSGFAEFLTLGSAESYRLSISWGSKCVLLIRPGQSMAFYGYPSKSKISLRPLSVCAVDPQVLRDRKAKQIEEKVQAQLNRNIAPADHASIADRKRRLLWMFFRIGELAGPAYIDRLNRGALNDELAQSLRRRLSTELRAELMGALRGARPGGVEPT